MQLPTPPGYDLRGVIVGSEGTLGIVTKVLVRLTENHLDAATLLMAFDAIEDAARTVSDVIGAGLVPAALEMMDNSMCVAVENFVHAGYPTDAGRSASRRCLGPPRQGPPPRSTC